MKKFKLLTLIITIITALCLSSCTTVPVFETSSNAAESGAENERISSAPQSAAAEDGSSDSTAAADGRLRILFIDIGQGDSELIMLPDGKTVLVDAGNPGDGSVISGILHENGVSRIDYLIATHPHADHIGGMAEIVKNFEIGRIFAPRLPASKTPTTKTYERFLDAVADKGYKLTAPAVGDTLFEGDGYSAVCLAPSGGSYSGLNNYSIVFNLSFKQNKFLFMGDAEEESEAEIPEQSLAADVLKVGHHGSSSSSSKTFLKAVSPKYAVISCGDDNSYGHPHEETLENLKSVGATVYRTDLSGSILCTSDGQSIDFKEEK